jgi:hypothetical protein
MSLALSAAAVALRLPLPRISALLLVAPLRQRERAARLITDRGLRLGEARSER